MEQVQGFDFNKYSLVLITGASQGIGRKLAIELAKRLTKATFMLIARNGDNLEATKRLIDELNKDIKVTTCPMDLSKPDFTSYQKLFENIEEYDNALIIHNAGSLGTIDNILTYTDTSTWNIFWNLNIISTSLLNSAFVTAMRTHSKQVFVVNITSLCGSVAFKNLGMYGSGKAARNLFFQVLAAEETDLVVLNYSPGPVETDMFNDVRENAKDSELKASFNDMFTNKTVLSTEMTSNKFIGILEKGGFKSGVTIDYFDRI